MFRFLGGCPASHSRGVAGTGGFGTAKAFTAGFVAAMA
jgi:hypothetical protein